MKYKTLKRDFLFSATFVLILLSLFKFLLHFIVNTNGAYGFFRDEFYYIACSDHLAWGYVDQPPFSILMLSISRFFLGDSLVAIRFLPALLGALTVFTTGKITKELEGGIFAQVTAAISVIVAPIFLAMNNYYSMNSFDIFFWALAAYMLVLIIKTNKNNLWYLLGLVIGIALMNKISILWLCAGLFTWLILTKNRKILLTKELWLSFIIAGIIFIPYVIWEFVNDFPTLEFMKNAIANKYVLQSPLSFLTSTILIMNPITFPLWGIGLYYFLFNSKGKEFRTLGVLFLTVLFILLLNPASKAEYFAPSIPMLFAAGGTFIENLIEKRSVLWLKPVIIILLVLGIWVAPLAMPILPVRSYIKYTEFLGVTTPASERHKMGALPQYFADMFGWKEITRTVADVYNKLSPEEKKQCVIYGQNYGEAGAINFYGKKYNLPVAVSGHNNFYLWGPGKEDINVIIVLGDNVNNLGKTFNVVIPADTIRTEYSMPYENNLPVFICKEPKEPITKIWPQTKNYN